MGNYDVDLVYTWVDGSDENWKRKKLQYSKEDSENLQNVSRFIDNEELKYSLRSVEKNANWINKIYIVTDNQIPKWLNTNNPRIKIIDHKDIINNEYLPVFNSMAIEANIYKIPNLSEHFIYANDDTFIYRPVEKEFFFDKNNNPISRFKTKLKRRKRPNMYCENLLFTHNIVSQKTGKTLYFQLHHNIDSYTKSLYIKCAEEFKEEFENVSKLRFRACPSFDRTGVNFYSVMTGNGTFRRIKEVRFRDYIYKFLKIPFNYETMYFRANRKYIAEKLKFFNPYLFCINDTEKVSNESRSKIKDVLEEIFPEKSSFEI